MEGRRSDQATTKSRSRSSSKRSSVPVVIHIKKRKYNFVEHSNADQIPHHQKEMPLLDTTTTELPHLQRGCCCCIPIASVTSPRQRCCYGFDEHHHLPEIHLICKSETLRVESSEVAVPQWNVGLLLLSISANSFAIYNLIDHRRTNVS